MNFKKCLLKMNIRLLPIRMHNRRHWFDLGVGSIVSGLVTLFTLGHYDIEWVMYVLSKKCGWLEKDKN